MRSTRAGGVVLLVFGLVPPVMLAFEGSDWFSPLSGRATFALILLPVLIVVGVRQILGSSKRAD